MLVGGLGTRLYELHFSTSLFSCGKHVAVVLVVGVVSLNGKHRAVVLVAGGLSEVVLVPNIVSSSQHRTEPLNGNLCSTSCSSIRCHLFCRELY